MESKAGSILALIAGIMLLIISVVIIFIIILFWNGAPFSTSAGASGKPLVLLIPLATLIFSILYIVSSYKMKKNIDTKKWATICLIVAIISIPISMVFSFIPSILGIIAGIMGINNSKK